MGIRTPKRSTLVRVTLLAVLALSAPRAAGAQAPLRGTIVDKDTKKPVAFVTVILDGERSFFSTGEGAFNFGNVADGPHVLDFNHISYRRRSLAIDWPSAAPLLVELEPSQFMAERIVVEGERTVPSLPVGSVSLDRDELVSAPGNIANDPLRTVQSQPSCAADGVDFLSKMAVRGGDGEEHRVYLDGYPLAHYAHVGGFAGVVYDDMLARTTLVPGAAPIQYTGSLSGVVLLETVPADSSFRSFRYDITSMAGGVSAVASPSLSFQAAAKTDFFNLPVYQQQGVEERSFRDLFARATVSPTGAIRATGTVLAAMDSETGNAIVGGKKRDVNSAVAGVDLAYRSAAWEMGVRPFYSYYRSRDAISWFEERTHRLDDARLHAHVVRPGNALGLALVGEAGSIRHTGSGGARTDYPYSASAELRLLHRELAALVFGAGVSREPWTSKAEPEAYASTRVNAGGFATMSVGARRSHQSPFLFTERRTFASLPIDAGDLMGAYAPSWENAPAVRMDQTSVGATVSLPFECSVGFNGFRRWYENLLTWEWRDFPGVANAASEGAGHGSGYEVVLERNDPDRVSLVVAMSRATVAKREGSLAKERAGDFDRPGSWQAGASVALTRDVRLAVRWMDVDGRPYTSYAGDTTPPADDEVNAVRLPRFQRLDVKVSYTIHTESFEGAIFVDMVNFLDRRNIAMMQTIETSAGTFDSAPYGGTGFFPIGGMTLRW